MKKSRPRVALVVEQLDLSSGGKVTQTFTSVAEAAAAVGADTANIFSCCRGTRKSCAGFRWRYARDAPLVDSEENRGVLPQLPDTDVTRKRRRRRGQDMLPSGENYVSESQQHTLEPQQQQQQQQAVEQIDLETGQVLLQFPSINEAARACGRRQAEVLACCLGNNASSCAGYGWRFAVLNKNEYFYDIDDFSSG